MNIDIFNKFKTKFETKRHFEWQWKFLFLQKHAFDVFAFLWSALTKSVFLSVDSHMR